MEDRTELIRRLCRALTKRMSRQLIRPVDPRVIFEVIYQGNMRFVRSR